VNWLEIIEVNGVWKILKLAKLARYIRKNCNVCQEVGIYLIYLVDWCSLGSVSTLTKRMIILSPKNEFVF
jgi:hypothetical protein